jgi:hypothetical protein
MRSFKQSRSFKQQRTGEDYLVYAFDDLAEDNKNSSSEYEEEDFEDNEQA